MRNSIPKHPHSWAIPSYFFLGWFSCFATLNFPFALLGAEIWRCLFALTTLGWLVQGRGGFPVGYSLDAKPIPALPHFSFGAGILAVSAHPEDPPPPCPFPELLRKTPLILIRQMTFPAALSKQIPCRELQEIWSRPCQFLLSFASSSTTRPSFAWPPVESWTKERIFFLWQLCCCCPLAPCPNTWLHSCFNELNLHLTSIILFVIMKCLCAVIPKSNRAPPGERDCAAPWKCWLCPTPELWHLGNQTWEPSNFQQRLTDAFDSLSHRVSLAKLQTC